MKAGKMANSRKAVFFALSFFIMSSVIYSLASTISSRASTSDEMISIEKSHAVYSGIETSVKRIVEGTSGMNFSVYEYPNVSVVFENYLTPSNTNLKDGMNRLKQFVESQQAGVNLSLTSDVSQNLTFTIYPYNVSYSIFANSGGTPNISVIPSNISRMRNITSYNLFIYTGADKGTINWFTVNTGNFPFVINLTSTTTSTVESRNIDPEKPLEVRITGLQQGRVDIFMTNYTRLEMIRTTNSLIKFAVNISFARISLEDVYVSYPISVNITTDKFNYSRIFGVKIKT